MEMKQAGSILIVDDNPDILIAVKLLLKSNGFNHKHPFRH